MLEEESMIYKNKKIKKEKYLIMKIKIMNKFK